MYKFNKKFTNEFLISEIHRFVKENGRVPIQSDMCAKNGYISSTTYANYFGSWNNALIVADVPLNNYVGYTKEFLISEIHRFISQYGEAPTLETFNNDKSYPSSGAFRVHFDTWNHVLIEAGTAVNNFTEYTKELLISELYRFIEENDRVPAFDDMGGDYPHATTYASYFGSWTNAISVAGIDRKDYFKKYLISELHRFVDNEGHIPSAPEMKREDGYPAKNTYVRYFDGWNNALIAADLELNRDTYTDNYLIEKLQAFYNVYERTPKSIEFNGGYYPSSVTYRERFDSWNNALELAGLDINQTYCYTDDELLSALNDYFKTYGEVPTTYALTNNSNYPSSTTYIERFGSWTGALLAAGLEIVHFFHWISDADYCTICNTKHTPGWRHDATGNLICKACAARLWNQAHPEKVQERRHRRRGYGFYPINDLTKDFHAHHLHLEDDHSFIVYIPEFIHQLHGHNSDVINSMTSVNALALDYWINEDLYKELFNGGDVDGTNFC